MTLNAKAVMSDQPIPNWQPPPRVKTLVTTREGGVSLGPYGARQGRDGLNLGAYCGDSAEAVAENRRRLAGGLPSPPVWLKQVHGTRVHALWDEPLSNQAGGRVDEPEADAAVTNRRGLVLAVLSADCLPVLLCDHQQQVVAAAHAGWRGLAAGVLEATVAAMREQMQPDSRIMAWLGPAIGPNAFEVGEDVVRAFGGGGAEAAHRFVPGRVSGKWFADLPGLAVDRLRSCGVEHISASSLCTFSRADTFYSHRRDRITGRQACLIWLEP
jgi:YfiH family protein